jgi:hypothetical protein
VLKSEDYKLVAAPLGVARSGRSGSAGWWQVLSSTAASINRPGVTYHQSARNCDPAVVYGSSKIHLTVSPR